jgi:hypothetical protein
MGIHSVNIKVMLEGKGKAFSPEVKKAFNDIESRRKSYRNIKPSK